MNLCIIKLGAKGDVIRTLPLLIALKNKFPDSKITWITKKSSEEIVKTSQYVKEVITIPISAPLPSYDILYNFDIDDEATSLAMQIKAGKKYGFYAEAGYPASFNFQGEYYLSTIFDDEVKKSNTKNYQEMMFEIAELPYNKEHHSIFLSEKENKYAKDFIIKNPIKGSLIGIHLGAADRWPSKKWHQLNLIEFIVKAKARGFEILLFGGPNEIQEHEKIYNALKSENLTILRNNPQNTDLEFTALVNLCKVMICSDSFALHVALAMKKHTIGLFFCTPPNEVEEYGLLHKLVSPYLYEFFPEKMDVYDENLTKSISADQVLEEVQKIIQ